MKSKTVVFFGNERLATGVTTHTPTLVALIRAGYRIAAVVTNNSEAHTRKMRTLEVVEVAKKNNIPVLSPEHIKEIVPELKALNADIGILAAYGKIVPEQIIDIFPYGIINIHPSLLPLHRGSTPIESVILDGSTKTGVSIMQLVKEMDAGPIYSQEEITLDESTKKQELSDRLALIGSRLVIKLLPAIFSESVKPQPQDNGRASYDKLLTKDQGIINWNAPADLIARTIRAYAIWPKSKTILLGKKVTVTAVRVAKREKNTTPGKVYTENSHLVVDCKTNAIEILSLIPEGKKEMDGRAFLAGYGTKKSN